MLFQAELALRKEILRQKLALKGIEYKPATTAEVKSKISPLEVGPKILPLEVGPRILPLEVVVTPKERRKADHTFASTDVMLTPEGMEIVLIIISTSFSKIVLLKDVFRQSNRNKYMCMF